MAQWVKNLPAWDTGDVGTIAWLGRSPGGGKGNPLQYSHLKNPMIRGVWWVTVHRIEKIWNGTPLQYSCLENPRDGGAWWAAVHEVAQSWIWLNRLSSSSSMLGITIEKNLCSQFKLKFWIPLWPVKSQYCICIEIVHINKNIDFIKISNAEV